MRSYLTICIMFVVASITVAQPLSGKLVEVESGDASVSTVLTNGACFKVGSITYRLELDPDGDAAFIEELNRQGVPIRMADLPAKEAFTMLTHLSGATIVCARDVDQELVVNINAQDDSTMSVIEQVCFQIGAEAAVRKGTVWITPVK